MNYLAHLFGTLGLFGTIAADNQNNKRLVLNMFVFANMMYVLQYLFLNAWTGVITDVFAIIRTVIYYLYEAKEKPKSVRLLMTFMVIVLILGISTYQDIFSVFPITCTLALTWALWQPDILKFRITAIITPILYFIYNYHVGAYAGMVATIFELAGALFAIYRLEFVKIRKSHC